MLTPLHDKRLITSAASRQLVANAWPAMNAHADRRIDKKHPDLMFALRTIAAGAIACSFCACQATEATLEPPPVMEVRKNEVEIREKADAEVIRIGGSSAPSLPVGDWKKGGAVSEAKKTPTTEG